MSEHKMQGLAAHFREMMNTEIKELRFIINDIPAVACTVTCITFIQCWIETQTAIAIHAVRIAQSIYDYGEAYSPEQHTNTNLSKKDLKPCSTKFLTHSESNLSALCELQRFVWSLGARQS